MWVFVNAISFQTGLQIQKSKQSELRLINKAMALHITKPVSEA